MKKGSYILLLSLALLIVFSCQLYGETSGRWKVGHIRQSGSAIDKDLHQFIDRISTGIDNKIVFDIYPGNRLGDYSVVQERVSFGEVQLYVGPLATSIDKRLLLATIPYLVNNWSEARKTYVQDSDLFKIVAGYLEEQNIKLLGGWPVYFGGIGLRENPPEPGNPDVNKEMIIRVPPIRSFELAARELGYTAYPITWTYAKMGLKTGMVDGIIGGGAEGYSNLTESIKYYIPVRDHFEYWFLYMNLKTWNGLSEEEQLLFLGAAKKMEKDRYLVAETQEEESIQLLKKRGVTILELSDTELKAMRDKIQQKVWPQLEKEVGPEFSRILAEIQER